MSGTFTPDIDYSAVMSGSNVALAVGDLVCRDSTGYYVTATDANIGTGGLTHGISLDVCQANVQAAVRVQTSGYVPPEITGLGTGVGPFAGVTAYVRRSSTGKLERAAWDSTSEFLGKCDQYGGMVYGRIRGADGANGTNGTNGATGATGATGGAGWTTLLDIDFSAQSNQTLASDTTYTIGGKTWTKRNSVKDSTAMAIVNGSGLVVVPVAATDANGANLMPSLEIKLIDLLATIEWSSQIRLWCRVAASNHAANYDNAVMYAGDPAQRAWQYNYFRGHNTTDGFWGRREVNSGATDMAMMTTSIPNGTNDVMVMELRAGLDGVLHYYSRGTYSAGWPAPSALSHMQGVTDGAPGTLGSLVPQLSAYVVALSALRAGSGTAYSVTFSHFRVDYR